MFTDSITRHRRIVVFSLSLRTLSSYGKRTGLTPIHDVYARTAKNINFFQLYTVAPFLVLQVLGKKSPSKVCDSHQDSLPSMTSFGDIPSINNGCQAYADTIEFLCQLYDPISPQCSDINEMRYSVFYEKGISGEKLPLTTGALSLHLARSPYYCSFGKTQIFLF